MQKRCQKHVGIDLEVGLANMKNDTPSIVFAIFVELSCVPNPNKTEETTFPTVTSLSIKFWIDFFDF